MINGRLTSGKQSQKLWKDPPFSMGKSTISMVIFNSKLLNYQRVIVMLIVIND